MTVDTLLERLDGVRSTGRDRWVARCPSHNDGRPSLSVRESDTGVVLVHCFGGCTVAEVAAAAGINLVDLFPPRHPDAHSSRPRVSSLTPLVATFERDLLILQILLADLAQGTPIDDIDCATARAAAGRVWAALQEAQHVI